MRVIFGSLWHLSTQFNSDILVSIQVDFFQKKFLCVWFLRWAANKILIWVFVVSINKKNHLWPLNKWTKSDFDKNMSMFYFSKSQINFDSSFTIQRDRWTRNKIANIFFFPKKYNFIFCIDWYQTIFEVSPKKKFNQ